MGSLPLLENFNTTYDIIQKFEVEEKTTLLYYD